MIRTYKVIENWFDCLANKRFEELFSLMAEDIHWVNLRVVPGVNDCVPWLGEFFSKADVLKSFERFGAAAQVDSFHMLDIHIDGEYALVHVKEKLTVFTTGLPFNVDDIFKMRVVDGKVTEWESFWDPSGAIRAFRG